MLVLNNIQTVVYVFIFDLPELMASTSPALVTRLTKVENFLSPASNSTVVAARLEPRTASSKQTTFMARAVYSWRLDVNIYGS